MNRKIYHFKRYLKIFDKHEKRKLLIFATLQSFTGILDLVGVGLLGIAGALSVRSINGLEPGNRTNQFLNSLPFEGISTFNYIILFLAASSILLMGKTIISAIFSNKILKFVGRINQRLSNNVIPNVYTDLTNRFSSYSLQERIYYTTDGIENLTVGIAGAFLTLLADFTVLLTLSITLILIDFKTTCITLIIFGSIGFLTTKFLGREASTLGGESNRLSILSSSKILEIEKSYKTLSVNGRLANYIYEILHIRNQAILIGARKAFLPSMSKYIVELVMVLGTLSVALLQLSFNSALHAAGSLTIFIASISRIAPATLRLQQGVILIKGNLRAAERTIIFMELADFAHKKTINKLHYRDVKIPNAFDIEADGLSFTYSIPEGFRLNKLSFKIPERDFLVIKGRSGAGKSTLLDLMLGVREPNEGSILVGNIPLKECLVRFPGAIYYVPQESFYIDASLKENLLFGFDESEVLNTELTEALDRVGLTDVLEAHPEGLEQLLGSGGRILSGGQLQRLAIARALLRYPRILFLDEPTSALDAESELIISNLLSELNDEMTIIMISHRDTILGFAKHVMTIENGRIIYLGHPINF